MVDALKRYQHDADCELFHKILFGELCENAYHSQIQMLSDFQRALHDRDKKLNGKKSAKGVLKRENFIAVRASLSCAMLFLAHIGYCQVNNFSEQSSCLAFSSAQTIEGFFPHKTDGDLKALRSALQYDQPLPLVTIDRIFDETSDGDQGKFVETLRDQNLYDMMSSYPAIEDSIRRAVQVEKGGSAALMANANPGRRLNAATDAVWHIYTQATDSHIIYRLF